MANTGLQSTQAPYSAGHNGPEGTAIGISAADKVGFYGTTPVVRPILGTAAVATATKADADSNDTTWAAMTTSTPWGFASQADAQGVLQVIINLQVRLADLEAKLKTIGIVS